VPAIGLDWAPKIVRGTLELFSAEHVALGINTLLSQSLSLWPLYLVFGGFIVLLFQSRPRLKADMQRRAAKVGRVKEDHTWHTPIVLFGDVSLHIPDMARMGYGTLSFCGPFQDAERFSPRRE